ncbi:MAG TPA: sigma-54 dependent transcriptional regulator [Dissulfurispiraceae bacterium]|nr:sigma-54 dependent transcriptional regulator [Dissulfurispiraceae bacterium]
MKRNNILIIEDDPIMQLGMVHFLKSEGYAVTESSDGEDGLARLMSGSFDLVITDLNLPGKNGLDVLRGAMEISPRPGVIIVTAYAEVKGAVSAIKEGAFDYIAKPFSNEELQIAVDRYFAFQSLEDEVTRLRKTLMERGSIHNIIGVSPGMMDVFDRISAVAGTDVPVLILGESGTGKELVANAIHGSSMRSSKPLIKINCAAIPENLFESELFGHEKGAFTGAAETRKGKFEFADGGTIFLDEIADIPLVLQPKLLRVLEDQMVTRLGGNEPIKVDVRSVYATSKNLRELVAEGKFREDLFYRINVVPVALPPLRQRKEDIPYIIDNFLNLFREKFNKPGVVISQPAYDVLLAYNYPGNVRELKHAIERGVVLSKDDMIEVTNLPDEIAGTSPITPCINGNLSLEQSIRCFERQKISMALTISGGKKMEAARSLGISRKVLWKKMKEHNLE